MMWTRWFCRLWIVLGLAQLPNVVRGEAIDVARLRVAGVTTTALGVTRQGTAIPALISADDLDPESAKLRIVLIGGLDGSSVSVHGVIDAMRRFYEQPEFAEARRRVALSAVPTVYPDQTSNASAKGAGEPNGALGRGFPPTGDFYGTANDPEAHYLWRWLPMHAPDVVVEVREQSAGTFDPAGTLTSALEALKQVRAAREMMEPGGSLFATQAGPWLKSLPALVREAAAFDEQGLSPWRVEQRKRARRTPREVAERLSGVFGQTLPTVQYIPALALVGRVRLGRMIDDPMHRADVERIVAPYRTGEKPALSAQSGGSEFAGHLIFAELADDGREEWVRLVRAVADRGFEGSGKPREAMPAHSEMSDAVFMSCPILAAAGRLTGEDRYYDMCLRHLRFMLKLNVRADGLHRHSPLDETAWGRGNGFPALGLAWTLDFFREDDPRREEILAAWRAHLDALIPHQDPTGTWHQVIDRPESYRELTATAMITYALAHGVRRGWLDRERYTTAIERGWRGASLRMGDDGTLVDVCTGTGKQRSLRDYYDRGAILGKDPRGGAMSLMLATEMMLYEGVR